MKQLQLPFERRFNQGLIFHAVSHLCTLALLILSLWLLDQERQRRIEMSAKSNACFVTAKQCDAELVTCIGWQARVSYELSVLLERECGL